jgi:hypothetical protein
VPSTPHRYRADRRIACTPACDRSVHSWEQSCSGDEAPECAELCHHISESITSGVFTHPGPERVVAVRKVVPVCVQLTHQRAHCARRVTPERCTATQPAGSRELDKLTGTLRSGSYPRDRRLPRHRRLPDRPARADHSNFSARHGNDVGNADNLPGLLTVHPEGVKLVDQIPVQVDPCWYRPHARRPPGRDRRTAGRSGGSILRPPRGGCQ